MICFPFFYYRADFSAYLTEYPKRKMFTLENYILLQNLVIFFLQFVNHLCVIPFFFIRCSSVTLNS